MFESSQLADERTQVRNYDDVAFEKSEWIVQWVVGQ